MIIIFHFYIINKENIGYLNKNKLFCKSSDVYL